MKVLIIILLIITFMSLTAISICRYRGSVSANELTEVIEHRTRNSKTFAISDNKYITDVSIGSIHYLNNDNEWVDIETDIVGSNYEDWTWQVTKGSWHLYIKKDTTCKLVNNGHSIGFKYKGLGYIDWVTKDYIWLQTAKDVIPEISGNKITWTNIFEGVNLEYIYTPDGFKEYVTITESARLWCEQHLPSTYGLNNNTSYLGGIIEVNFINSYSAESSNGTAIDWNNPQEFIDDSVLWRDPVKNKIVSALPVGYAYQQDNKEDTVNIRSRFYKNGNKHYWLYGCKVTDLNELDPGAIIFDPTIDEQVEANSDDCQVSSGVFHLNYTNQYIGTNCETGYRFQAVNIPNGATIDVAYTSHKSNENDAASTVDVDIRGEDADDTATFSTKVDFDGRSRTTASVDWTLSSWSLNTWYDSPSIVSIITEITSRPGWSANNDLCIFTEDDSSNGPRRKEYAHDGSGPDAVKLHVEYTPIDPPTVVTDNATGIGLDEATLNGNITNTGGQNCDYRGFEWGLSPGVYTDNWTEAGSFGTGTYDYLLSSLNEDDTYYYRAIAHNQGGLSNGSEVSFITKSSDVTEPADFECIQYDVDKIYCTWVDSANITATLVDISYDQDYYNSYNGTFESCNISGLDLNSTVYYLRASSYNDWGLSDYSYVQIGGDELDIAVTLPTGFYVLMAGFFLVFISFFLKSPLIYLAIIPCMIGVLIEPVFKDLWFQAGCVLVAIWAALSFFKRITERTGEG